MLCTKHIKQGKKKYLTKLYFSNIGSDSDFLKYFIKKYNLNFRENMIFKFSFLSYFKNYFVIVFIKFFRANIP